MDMLYGALLILVLLLYRIYNNDSASNCHLSWNRKQ